ncbi:RHS repeat domain-containing protein [Treponema sp. OMZ 787]|uniref:RHS repeat domain-containing protein n=1 Tax=Treponema sp. OMZ 787 TaxID=2563669 RepID=UPI0020A4BA04|nr:RHS repeat-associated core domain-containing protein [Treponema sp. OMZ 787]
MKPKLCICSQPTYLIRTAIEAKILFAVCVIKKQALTGGKSLACEDKCSKKIGAKSAVPVFVYLCIVLIVHKYRQSAKRKLLLNSPTDRTFGNRRSRYKEPSKNRAEAYRVYVEHLFLRSDAGDARIFSKEMTHTENQRDNDEQKAKRYYYQSDHLGSAQFVTDWRGKQYEHIEYTPYGELWIEETAPGIDKLPFRFTGKELDEETGLYYYGARYLDPKYSRWLSGDPALNDYIPKAPIDNEAKKHNENLPGMGGVFNVVNLHVYHYAGNNPVKYIDPDGEASILSRRINSNGTVKAYKIASKLGKIFEFAKHSLVDYGELKTFKDSYGMVHHLGRNQGIKYNELKNVEDRQYSIKYTNMDDNITKQAVENALNMERFGGKLPNGKHNNDSAKQKYKILINDCNAFTRTVFKEYKKLWKENWKKENNSTSRYQAWKAWRRHYKEISARRNEEIQIKH